jgi:hypothetical protein
VLPTFSAPCIPQRQALCASEESIDQRFDESHFELPSSQAGNTQRTIILSTVLREGSLIRNRKFSRLASIFFQVRLSALELSWIINSTFIIY